ncbi:MAG: prephenate dehydrogenase [Clostridia bacterium]|nr:prephenate dehydrogenase [Clostridia bacterium]
MKIGIVGLGLIGGSFARAIKEMTSHRVYVCEISESTLLAAKLVGAYDAEMNGENISECDIILVSLYPEKAVEFIKENRDKIKEGAVVVDCCGVKRYVCDEMKKVVSSAPFTFVGGHPMAGTQSWGFNYSRASMFKGASMILTPYEDVTIEILDKLKNFFLSLGFGGVKITTDAEHDRIIAFTSQLPHVISNAYVKSPEAQKQRGFSAGSYKDMTRISKLNSKMWAELFLENKDFLADEIDILVENLKQYSQTIRKGDREELENLLEDGAEQKRKAK